MRLVLRRARGALSLVLAAVVATLIAVTFVVGLLAYGRDVVNAAARATVASAPPEERAIIVRGAANAGDTGVVEKDAALRAALASGLGGRPVTVSAAGYGVGAQLAGDTGNAVGDDDGNVFANLMFLDDLREHATLLSGSWARPGATPVEATLGRAAAGALGIEAGERLPVTDVRSGTTSEVLVAGIWEPTDLADPYWLLTPGVGTGVTPGGSSYGPIALDRSDFLRSWSTSASVAWVVRPDLDGAGLPELLSLRQALTSIDLRDAMGLHDAGQVTTSLGRLADRLIRANLVGTSALLTPVLLITVLGVYALLLVAMLLTEHRRGETALIRARGAARSQIAALAVRESALLVIPALLLAPPLAAAALGIVSRLPVFADIGLGLTDRPSPWLWAASAVGAAVCLVAMVAPSIRRSGTYIEELGARSRPSRFAFAQRVGLDLSLVALALVAWFQLRQYASPLSGVGGTLGIDPLLVAAPTIGVLAGAVLSLRLLPRTTRLAERYVDRRHWPATMFGMWQAGRRPHAGPVLIVALAVAVSTLAWSLLSTAQRSIVDQADFGVGADLRLIEASGYAPYGRTAQIAALAGVDTVAPVSRSVLRLGPESVSTTVLGIEPTRAAQVMRYRDDLGGGPRAFGSLATARQALPVVALPAGAQRIAATVTFDFEEVPVFGVAVPEVPVLNLTATVLLVADDGQLMRLPLGTMASADGQRDFEVALPPAQGLSIVGFNINVLGLAVTTIDWKVSQVRAADAGGAWTTTDLNGIGTWVMVDAVGDPIGSVRDVPGDPGGLFGSRSTEVGRGLRSMNFSVVPYREAPPVPVLATADVLRALRVDVGESALVTLGGAEVSLHVVGEVQAVPGTTRTPAAVLADLPSLSVALGRARPAAATIAEHWVAVEAAADDVAVGAALPGVRVLDRASQADVAGRDPYGIGGRSALFAAGLGALLLALIGIAVDIRATARRRVGEFAVLQTMGAGSRLLARAVLAEQGFLAGLGVLVGLGVGIGVAATLAPLLILTPTADRPEPEPLLSVPWLPVLGTAVGLFAAAMLVSGAVAATLGRRLAVARLRIGDET
jgi:hypothetical protein